MSERPTDECQVLVVGAGPTGLVLAAELLRRGVRTRILDRGDGMALESRALGVHARTLEVLDLMGVADRFLARGHPVRRLRMYAEGRSLIALDYARSGSRFGFMLDIPQHETERLLRERVAELGGRVEQGRELVGVGAAADHVTATFRDAAGQVATITSRYLVGCDGAHSRVRHELGLDFDGHPYSDDWLLADVRLDWDRAEDEMHAFFRADGRPLICMPLRDHAWRVILPFTGERGRAAPTLREIQELVDRRAPAPVTVSEPTWLACFRCHRRSTDVYRRGRVLLAGDAVHVHSPAGGQGMNTGIMDAHNLAWKLALVASGRSPESLLDTYGEERAPVAREVLSLTHALVTLGSVRDPARRALRDAVLPAASRVGTIQRRAVRRLSHVHVAYRASRLAVGGGEWAGRRPGDRVDDLGLVDVLRGGSHVLVVAASDPSLVPSGLEAYRDLFEVAAADRGPRGAVALVRPDGHLAAVGQRALLDYLRAVTVSSGPLSGSGRSRVGCPVTGT